jgi:RNA polymerase sigma-70 factor (ECF subfamily)
VSEPGPVAATQPTDDLVAVAKSDAPAFGRLYEAYRLSVYRYLRSRSDSDEDAADLVAATFEHAFRGLAGYRPQGSPIGWLLRIARNVAADAARRQKPAALPLERLSIEHQPFETETTEDSVLWAERAAELQGLVRRLPVVQRDAVILRYASGLTGREIGEVIGKSEAATQKLLTRALDALKEAYDVQR